MKIGLTGKRAIVTGGSRGIGYAIADALAAEGMAVSICARGQQGLDAASKNLSRHGGNVHSLAADVASKEGIEGYMDAAITALGGVDVLVNNTSAFGGSEDEAGWDSSLNVDVMALVRASWKARASMAETGGGSNINISSITGLATAGRTPPYGAAKAAVIQYTKTQAYHYASDNIRVNCIAPGSIYFEGGVWGKAEVERPELFEKIRSSIPFGRLGAPEEVANLAVFLASDAASWVTGQTIAADGGQTLNPI